MSWQEKFLDSGGRFYKAVVDEAGRKVFECENLSDNLIYRIIEFHNEAVYKALREGAMMRKEVEEAKRQTVTFHNPPQLKIKQRRMQK